MSPRGRQTFRNIVVVPQRGRRHCGGPIWPLHYLRIRARTCWGVIPIPIDTRPDDDTPRRTIRAGFWCGLVGFHYGHMIADFSMRIVSSAACDPNLPLIFSLPEHPDFRPPPYFWQVLEALGVERRRVLFVREPVRVETLHVFPQAERLYGGGPSKAHLDLMDRRLGRTDEAGMDLDIVYVSRSRVNRGGQIAGEGYLEERLAETGVHVVHPQTLTVPEQIALYRRAKRLIFSEGSAVHTLQLVGRLGADVAVLVRRPRRWLARASLRPRTKSLTYLQAVEGLVHGLGRSRRVQRHRGISILSEDRLLRAFRRIGIDLAPHWSGDAYRARRDADIRSWIAHRQEEPRPHDEARYVDARLASLGIPVRYGRAADVPA